MNNKVIRITHCKHVHTFKIELFEPKKFVGFPYFRSVMFRNDIKWRDVQDYKMAWQKEFGVEDENIFDLTK